MNGSVQTLDADERQVVIRQLAGDDEARQCADIMVTSEPWITLHRSMEQALQILADRDVQEVYVAAHQRVVVGFLILVLKGAFVGYIRTVAVHPHWRSRGLGRRLIEFAEQRIFRDSPNVFLCVSSFNDRARALYERLGYERVGELPDYIVRGHSELIMRKTLGPHGEFRRE